MNQGSGTNLYQAGIVFFIATHLQLIKNANFTDITETITFPNTSQDFASNLRDIKGKVVTDLEIVYPK